MQSTKKASKILVTGASGYLGNQILHYLWKQGYHNLTGTYLNNYPKQILPKEINLIQLDILDVLGVEDCLENFDIIIHTAGLVSYQPEDKKALFKTNIEGTANLVNAALLKNIKLMVHISSTSAFGIPPQQQCIDEHYLPDPSQFITDYALSKWYGELEVWRGMKEGLKAAIICPSIIIGPTKGKKSTDIFKDEIAKGLKLCPKGSIGFVDHRDICKLVIEIIEKDICDKKYIVSSDNLTWQDFFSRIAKHLGKNQEIKLIGKGSFRLMLFVNYMRSLFKKQNKVPTEMARYMMKSLEYDGSLATKELDFSYIPIEKTISDYVSSVY